MTMRPVRIAQTSKEVKKEHKKNKTGISENQLRLLKRDVALDERARRFREQEERKRIAKRKREEKERKEREARKQLGVGLATQLVGYSHTQAQLKTGMEAFLGLRKRQEEDQRKQLEVQKKLNDIAKTVEAEPWDEGEEAFGLNDLQSPESPDDYFVDDDLDDDTLLEIHDEAMILNPRQTTEVPDPDKGRVATGSSPLPAPTKHMSLAASTGKDDPAFLRMHGPVNKAIEDVLANLPGPLIELLSVDVSANQVIWAPPATLLHKLNPTGLPPHRLRIKVGCTVSLLRDLESSTQLPKSNLLSIVRVERERLECLVLDGPLKGTKVFLTKVPFRADHRNDARFPFQRMQYPIRVSTDPAAITRPPDTSIRTFKVPLVPARSNATSKGSCTTQIHGFLPASHPKQSRGNAAPPTPRVKPPLNTIAAPPSPNSSDGWADFLDSSTQIARELSSGPDDGNKPSLLVRGTMRPLDRRRSPQALSSAGVKMNSLSKPWPHDASPHYIPSKLLAETPLLNPATAMAPPPRPTMSLHGQRTLTTLGSPKKPPSPMKHPGSFTEFGLSTQEVYSFFDDDDI